MSLREFEVSAHKGRPDEFYVFEILGGQTYRYTPMRMPITHNGFEYTPKAMQRSNYTFKKDVTSEDSLKIDVQADLDILSQFKIIVPRRTTNVTIYRRHRGDSQNEAIAIFRGRIRGVTWNGAKATIECDAMTHMAKRGGLTTNFQVPCNHFVYSVGCRLNKGDWAAAGLITGLRDSNRIVESPVFATKPDGYWKYGFIEVGDGAYTVVSHSGSSVTLMNGMEGVGLNTEFQVYPGCDRTLDTCWDKFNNGLNHLGFKWSPADNVFETGI